MVHVALIIDYREQKIHFITSTMRIEYIEQLDPHRSRGSQNLG